MRPEFEREELRREKPPEREVERTPEAEGPESLASSMGNQAVQRVAASPELQASPPAARLVSAGSQAIARRASLEEEELGSAGNPEGPESVPLKAGTETETSVGPEKIGKVAGTETEGPEERIGDFAGVEQESETHSSDPPGPAGVEELGDLAGVEQEEEKN